MICMVSSSGSQQMGINVDLKNSMGGSMPPQSYYYQNQGVSPLGQLHLQQQQQQQQASQSQVSESATFMNTNTIQSNSGNIVTNGNNQGQTINFTQQHLRMSTGITPSAPGMNRMMVPGPGPPVQGSGVMTRMGMPPRMSTPSGTGPTMSEMGMGPRMEMQRMMRQQQVRGQSLPPQQMMRPPGPGEMMTQQQMMASQGAMMNRFTSLASNPSSASGPGRPGPGGQSMISGGPGQVANPNMSNIRMQQSMYGPGHGMGPMCGTTNNLAMGGNISMNNMNMPMRRMPSFNPASGVGPNPPTNISVRPGGGSGISQSMMVSSQSQQQSMGSSSEWMAMSDPNMRNYPGANIPQPPHQPMRPNTNPGGFHQGMGMQMTQQQQHSMGQMQRGDGSMCGVVVPVGSQPGLSANQMGNMGYSQQPQQQQQMPVGGNPGSYSQSSMTVNKLSQSQTTMCVSSNFTMKSGGGMAISNSTGSGGTMMCANSQSMNQMCNSMKPSSTDMTNQDFNFDLLENITGGDASSFNSDSDFLSSFDSNSNYHNILDSL
ncbi:unnamed protein product [Allacma fusca]|uniref:Uncharacterized protein n=1 Tax=Allacma fusca TaxID=39272 RepID=A0A8J2PI30_9HEXA|nr:unnamed protein product [Allacma fusca]